jgi:hypothetical protein
MNYDGYYRLREALLLCLEDEKYIGSISELYEKLSEMTGDSKGKIARVMCYSITKAFESEEMDNRVYWMKLFGKIKKRPKNGTFIAAVVKNLQMQSTL